MANKITIINKQTLKEKAKGFFYIGLAGLVLYSLYNFGHYFLVTKPKHDRIEEAAKIGDLVLAKKLLEANDFSVEDKVSLEFSIEKYSELRQYSKSLEGCLNVLDFDKAKTILKEAESSKLLNDDDLRNLEKIVYEKTEKGFCEKLFNLYSWQKLEVLKDYLKTYPNGIYKENLISATIHDLLSEIKQGHFLKIGYPSFASLNLILEENPKLNFSLPEINKAESLIDEVMVLYQQNGTIRVGSNVKVVFSPIKTTGYPKDYVEDRDYNFNIGTIGEVVAIIEDKFYVKFQDINGHWDQDWYDELERLWLSYDTKKIGEYKISELEFAPLPLFENESGENLILAENLIVELEKLKKNLEKYKTGQ
ncbi:hypothetical protein HZA97_02570 [Candidatus Woesearchaeota archaeon]|nr:hypothetical protein [Candidatus Woesearchaeota archaeon]